MLTLKPYPAYKTSALGALGTIPAHWSEVRAKYLFREIDDRSISGDEELLSVSHITGVTPRSQKNVTMFLAESNVGHKRCRPDDLVINTMWAWMGALGVSRFAGIVSPSYGVYRPRTSDTNPWYLDQLLRTNLYVDEYVRCSTGINSSRLRLYPDSFLRIPILIPPVEEQEQIRKFIRSVLGASSKLIRAKRRVIELLNEQKQAIIHRAVTRGLDPNVRLKPSGVDWLGAVPAHWDVKRLKWVTRLQRGYDLPSDQRQSGNVPVVSSGGIIGTHNESRAQAPGVVMGRYGSTDSVFYIEEAFWPHNTALFVTDFQRNDPRWCYYLLRLVAKIDLGSKSAVPGVDRKDLYEIPVALPPIEDQPLIVKLIEDQLERLNAETSAVQREIDLLREYRTRLIADVVTGKLDVRGVELPAASEDEAVELLGESDGEDLAEAEDAQEDETVEA
jgi:type I restriction enzyme S subunit